MSSSYREEVNHHKAVKAGIVESRPVSASKTKGNRPWLLVGIRFPEDQFRFNWIFGELTHIRKGYEERYRKAAFKPARFVVLGEYKNEHDATTSLEVGFKYSAIWAPRLWLVERETFERCYKNLELM